MHFRLLEVDGFRNTFDKVNGYGKQVNAYYKIESLEESFDNKYQQTYQNLQLKNDSGDDITKLSTA